MIDRNPPPPPKHPVVALLEAQAELNKQAEEKQRQNLTLSKKLGEAIARVFQEEGFEPTNILFAIAVQNKDCATRTMAGPYFKDESGQTKAHEIHALLAKLKFTSDTLFNASMEGIR